MWSQTSQMNLFQPTSEIACMLQYTSILKLFIAGIILQGVIFMMGMTLMLL